MKGESKLAQANGTTKLITDHYLVGTSISAQRQLTFKLHWSAPSQIIGTNGLHSLSSLLLEHSMNKTALVLESG